MHRAPVDAACAAFHAAALGVDSPSLEAGTMDVSRRRLWLRFWHGVCDRNDSVNTLPFADWKGPLRRHSLYHADSAYSQNRFRFYFVDTVAKSKSKPNPKMDVNDKKIDLGFELDSSSEDERALKLTDPDETQPIDTIQQSPYRSPTVSPVIMQPEAADIELPQKMKDFRKRKVRFEASADSEGRRKPPKCGKLSSQALNSLLREERPKDIEGCMKMIEEAIHAKAGPMEALVTVTRVAAIAIGYADADRRKKATQRRKELALKRKELKKEQAEAARIEMQEAQVAVMNKH